jgi:hypothetical protein
MSTEGNTTVYEDDGATLRYDTDNAIATTTMRWTTTESSEFLLTVDPTVGSFDVNGDCGETDAGFDYGGPGADLQELPGTRALHPSSLYNDIIVCFVQPTFLRCLEKAAAAFWGCFCC